MFSKTKKIRENGIGFIFLPISTVTEERFPYLLLQSGPRDITGPIASKNSIPES